MRKNTREGVQNLTESILAYIRGKQIDKLEKNIGSARKHDFFDLTDSNF
jgi:hypothetical protein